MIWSEHGQRGGSLFCGDFERGTTEGKMRSLKKEGVRGGGREDMDFDGDDASIASEGDDSRSLNPKPQALNPGP